MTRHPLYAPYVAEKTKVSAATDSIMMSPTTQPLHIDQYNSRDSNSDYTGSSVSSEDLAAMYFDLVPRASQPHQLSIKTPPLLSTGMPSPASSQEDPILSFTTFSYSLSIDKKTTRDYNGSRNP